MAIVYRVLDTGRDEEVALKQLQVPEDLTLRRKLSALFEREFYVLAQLAHPSVVQVYDFGHDSAGPYYTMELLDGGDLDQLAPLPARDCCELMLQVCSALSLLHSRGFVHRDVSPRNVRRTRTGHAKLIDFGAMIPMGPSRQVVGTPAFIAPESLHGLSLDARTDLFSLGATLYFALTGRAPFVARAFAELSAAWREPPTPPSALVESVPELDAVVLSLLRVDPAHRPRGTSEIIQRLAAIAGHSDSEAASVAQAYLNTPTLVGRDKELQQFRAAAARASQGSGAALWLHAANGVGRSRLLDAWVLEAKTQGLSVARASGSATARTAFGGAYELTEQVLEALPEASSACARQAGVFESLFEPTQEAQGRPHLLPLARLLEHRDKLPQNLTRFMEQLCREHVLCLVVDDAERLDEPSLAILAALVHAAPRARLLIALGVATPLAPDAPAALDVLARDCTRVALRALTRSQTEVLFSSVFGGVPNVALVSDRIHTISVGNPRAAMSVAQHMVDNGLIRYAEGSWLLPAELTLTELPADAEHLLRARVANLLPLARRLAELQALAIGGQFTRADYAELAGRDGAAQVDRAVDALVQLGLFASDGVSYTLAHQGDRALLLSELTPERCIEHHLALAEHFSGQEGLGLAEVHHLLQGGANERALDRLAIVIPSFAARGDIASAAGMSSKDAAATLERAFELSQVGQRPAREQQTLARLLVTLSIVTDNKLHRRYGPHWFARLERDSGLADYRAQDPSLPRADRVKRALDAAVARYAATPEDERVYRVDEAIRFLARYVTISIAIGARTRNGPLMHSLGGLLEPFSAFSTLLHALWQNAVSAYEMNFTGQVERARTQALGIYEKLAECQGADLAYAELIRNAIASALAIIDTGMGVASASHWLALIENDPLQAVNANYLRRLWCIVEGDHARAEEYRKRAEVLALQSSVRQMFMPPLRHELVVQIRAGDLAGVKHCADQIARLAEDEPGWRSMRHMALGYYQRLRGDLSAAQAEFERALALAGEDAEDPASDQSVRIAATAGYVGVLVSRGQADAACALGRPVLAQCEASGMQAATWDLVRELAMAEAKLGEHESAARRIDALIESRADVLEPHRVIDYETRLRLAIEAKDGPAIEHFAQLVARHGHGGEHAHVKPQLVQLAGEARRAGVELKVPETRFETSVLAPGGPLHRQLVATRVAATLAEASDRSSRAARAIALLCDSSPEVFGGQLYLADDSGLALAAEHGVEGDHDLQRHACLYWLQLGGLEDATAVLTQAEDVTAPSGDMWKLPDGARFRPIVLRSNSQRVGLALLASRSADPLASGVWEMASALATQLLELGDATGVTLD